MRAEPERTEKKGMGHPCGGRPRALFQTLACFVLAALGVVAFSTKIEVSGFSQHSNITLADNTLLWSALGLLLTWFYLRAGILKKQRGGLGLAILSLAFGFLNVLGHSMYYLDSWDFLFGNLYQCMLGSLCALGYAALFYAVGTALFSALDAGRFSRQAADRPSPRGLYGLYERRPFLCAAAALSLCYLVWLIVFYPGCTNYDINYQLRQFFGLEPWTNSHPALSTAIMGSCMWLGKLLSSDNLGMFLYMLLQAAAFVLVFSAIVVRIRALSGSRVLELGTLAFFALLPVWGGYAVQGMKDGLFSAVFAWYVLETLGLFVGAKGGKALSKAACVRFGLSALLTCLLRSAVIFLVLPSMACLVLFLLRGANRRRAAMAGISAAVLALGFIYALLPALGVIRCNRAESRSIPFQQTARAVRDHWDTLTGEEKAAIDAVLDVETIGEVYMPVLSDPVKDTYRQRDLPTEEEALAAYQKTWLAMFRKYPAAYLQATLGNSFGYYSFTPSIQTTNGHTGMCFMFYRGDSNGVAASETYRLQFPRGLEPVRSLFSLGALLVDAVPVVNLLYACAFYFWGTLLIALYAFTRRQRGYLAVLMPVILLMLGCIGSSVNDSFRYEAPIAAAFPLVLLCGALAARAAGEGDAGEGEPGSAAP